MVGRDQGSLFPKRDARLGEVALSVEHLQVADPANPERLAVDGLDLEIRAGEIVGVYGLMASGRTELLEAIAGRLPVDLGHVTFEGEDLGRAPVARADRAAASRWCPRTGSATGSSRRCRSGRTSRSARWQLRAPRPGLARPRARRGRAR